MNWTIDHIERLKESGKIIGYIVIGGKPAIPQAEEIKVKRKKRKEPELELQAACFSIVRFKYPKLASNFYSIPNGGYRHKSEARKLKASGTRKGVWDSFLSVPRNGKAGLYIEFKAGKNDLTHDQITFQVDNEQNYAFAVCYTVDEFITAIDDYLKTT